MHRLVLALTDRPGIVSSVGVAHHQYGPADQSRVEGGIDSSPRNVGYGDRPPRGGVGSIGRGVRTYRNTSQGSSTACVVSIHSNIWIPVVVHDYFARMIKFSALHCSLICFAGTMWRSTGLSPLSILHDVCCAERQLVQRQLVQRQHVQILRPAARQEGADSMEMQCCHDMIKTTIAAVNTAFSSKRWM